MSDSKKFPGWAGYLAIMALCVSTSAQTASEVFSATGITAGLCVQLGTGTGTTTCGLDNGGKFVVHGLSVDNTSLLATRAAIAASGKQGLISAEHPVNWSPLPYPDNFVNLLVGDLDALGTKAPLQSELERVLAPLGASYVKVSGVWKKYVKPMPKGMAEWRHWAGNGDGNNMSQDELVEPPTNVRWWAGHRHKVGKKTNNGFRLHQGIAVYEFYPGKIGSKSQPHALYGRDAFSGVLLWRQPGNNVYFGNDAYRSIVAGGGKVYTIDRGANATQGRAPMVAYDIRTGEKVKEYTNSLGMGVSSNDYTTPMYTGWWSYRERVSVVYVNGMLIQTVDNKVMATDAETGTPKWTYTEDVEKFVWQPVVSVSDNTVYVGAGNSQFGIIRIGHAWAKSFVALDLTTGARKWRHSLKDYHLITQLSAVPGRLYVFNQPEYAKPKDDSADVSKYEGYIAAIRATDGTRAWENEFTNGYGTSAAARIIVARDDKLHHLTTWKLMTYNTATGAMTDSISRLGFGGVGDHSRPGYGCDWNRSTVKYHMISGGFVDKSNNVDRHFISRSGCGTGMFPGYGTVYVPDAGCVCFSQVAGMVALSSDPVLTPLPEANRLLTSGPDAQPYIELSAPVGHIAKDWTDNDFYPDTLPTIAGDGMSYTVKVQLHRVVAKNSSGSAAWAYTTGGRISTAPVLNQGTLFVGSRDGWVYALDAKTGSLKWRFMAAPNTQKIMTASQIESRWPVMGLTMHDGAICASAGIHPEAGGGIYFYGMNPTNGSAKWRFNVRSPRGFTTAAEANKTFAPKMQNGKLESVNGQLQLVCFSHGPSISTFLLKPQEWNDQQINARGGLTPFLPSIVDSRITKTAVSRVMPDILVTGRKLTINFGRHTGVEAIVMVRTLDGKALLKRSVKNTARAGFDVGGFSGTAVVTVRMTGQFTSAVVAIP